VKGIIHSSSNTSRAQPAAQWENTCSDNKEDSNKKDKDGNYGIERSSDNSFGSIDDIKNKETVATQMMMTKVL